MLYAGALAISAFTIRRGGAPFDEGIVLQAAARIAEGQLPYGDFAWPYGPAHPYLLGWSVDLLGPSMMGWRVLRSLVDAGVAVTVYLLARRGGAPPPLALAGWLAAAAAMAQPTSATPFAPALLLALLAVAAATSTGGGGGGAAPSGRGAGARWGQLAAAATLTALAAAWRLDFGLYAGAAVVIALALGSAPARGRLRAIATYAGSAIGLGLLAHLPFLVAVGPTDLYESLVGASLRERDHWTLPFPIAYDGGLRAWPPGALAEDVKDVLGFYVPLLAVAGLALLGAATAFRARLERAVPAGLAPLAVLGAGVLAYLLSRPDEFHATPLIVVLAAGLPPAIAWIAGRRRARSAAGEAGGSPARAARRRAPAPQAVGAFALAAVLALLLAYGTANRLSALLRPPELATIDLPVADGAQAPPAEARALERMAAIVKRHVPPGEPIYTITRRSDLVRFNQPLVYLLAERSNPTRHDYALQTSPEAQRRLIERLDRRRPRAIVRWTDPISVEREPNLRGEPSGSRALDRWVAGRYSRVARAGHYEILAPRESRQPPAGSYGTFASPRAPG